MRGTTVVTRKPTAKADRTREQIYRDNMVLLMRRHLFIDGEPENECLKMMQWLVASHIAIRDHVEWTDIQELTEELAVEVKPLACEIIERAKKAGQP
jgi:hypothetical protein